MKQLLASLDVLDDDAAAAEDRGTAAAFIRQCHTKAEESCRTLRRQLAYAEELTDLLSKNGATAQI